MLSFAHNKILSVNTQEALNLDRSFLKISTSKLQGNLRWSALNLYPEDVCFA